jgi:AcrR family transcriptional regulator
MAATTELLDPRIKRTRLLLEQALESLLKKKGFEELSVQEIADAATVNRVTLYDHYADKQVLLEAVVARQLERLLDERRIQFDGTCRMALRAVVQGACDYLEGMPKRQRHSMPSFQAAIIAVLQKKLLRGFGQRPAQTAVPVEMLSTALAWAIYGAAQEWAKDRGRVPSEDVVNAIMKLVTPILDLRTADMGPAKSQTKQ